MTSLDLEQAAEFLKVTPEFLRREVKAGRVPGSKFGKNWLFIEEHLADWISGRYSVASQELRVIDGDKQQKEDTKCLSIRAVKNKSTGLTSLIQTETEYAKVLGLPIKNKLKNTMTN